ncbi:hypothetical protein [Thermospira aquatica]|uniref:Uncharacterized protein n=1 Tax=Thermospira aquatica TaxID=2828656 RepID=A0AAX3BFT7_9SPIR|nr:hypothetical protein [Thermospira aquatica]URA11162.1 hypothetical protein KDW03_05040 [Thermospira aquatica]
MRFPEWIHADEARQIELAHSIGISNKDEVDLFVGICRYAEKYNTSQILLKPFYKDLFSYAVQINNRNLQNEQQMLAVLQNVYQVLYKNLYLSPIQENGKVIGFILQDPRDPANKIIPIIVNLRNALYLPAVSNPKPFPTMENIPPEVRASEFVREVDIQTLSVTFLQEIKDQQDLIVIVKFPNETDMVVPAQDFISLPKIAWERLDRIFQTQPNLFALFVNKMRQLHKATMPSIENVEQFFGWLQKDVTLIQAFCHQLLTSVDPQKEKLLFQIGWILQAFTFLDKQAVQKEDYRNQAMKAIIQIFERYAVPFSHRQVLGFWEKSSVLRALKENDYLDLVKSFFDAYTVPEKEGLPPAIFVFRLNGEVRYIHRNHFLKIFLDLLDSVALDIKQNLERQAEDRASDFLRMPFMKTKDLFVIYLQELVEEKNDMLADLLNNTPLLFQFLYYHCQKTPAIKSEALRFFEDMDNVTSPVRRPLDEILRISYADLVKLAETNLPFNFVEFFLNFLVKPFQWFFGLFGKKMDEALTRALAERKEVSEWLAASKAKKGKKEETYISLSEVQQATQKTKVDDTSLEALIRSITGQEPLEKILENLGDKWNKTLSPEAKKDNYDLVHSKVLNRLKFLKHIDASVVQNEVNNIMHAEKFVEKIHNKDAFRAYITLWMASAAMQLHQQKQKK